MQPLKYLLIYTYRELKNPIRMFGQKKAGRYPVGKYKIFYPKSYCFPITWSLYLTGRSPVCRYE